MKHGINKYREYSSKHTPQERISSNSTRRKLLKSIDEVVEGCLENGEEAKTHADKTDAGCDPEYGAGGRPPEDEEAGCEENGPNHHGWEAGFGDGAVVVCVEFLDVEFVIPMK